LEGRWALVSVAIACSPHVSAESGGDPAVDEVPWSGGTAAPAVRARSESSAATGAEDRTDLLSSTAAGRAAVRGGALRVGGYAIGALVSAVGAALLLRHLGVVDTGRYVTTMSLVAIVGALSDLGITAIGVREIAIRPPEERWPLARDLLGLRITLTLVGGVAVIAIAWVAYSRVLAAGVALAIVGLLLQATQDNFAISLVVGLRLGWVAALDLMRQLLTTLSIALLVLLGSRLLPFLGMSIPVGIVVLAVAILLVRGARTLTPTFSWRRWRKFMSAILPYSVAVAASALYFRASILLVSALSSGTQLGYFSASFRVIEGLTVLPGLIVGSAFPIFARAARDDHERLGYGLERVFEVSVIVGSWLAISIAVGAPLAIRIIGGAAFKPAATVLAIQGIGLGAMFVNCVWGYGLLSLGLYRQIMLTNTSALALDIVLVAPLVLVDGARGAAIGTAAAEVVVGIVMAMALLRGRPQLRPSLRVLPRAALAATLGLIPLALPVPSIARILISTALFAAVLLATRAFRAELIDLLPKGRLGTWLGYGGGDP